MAVEHNSKKSFYCTNQSFLTQKMVKPLHKKAGKDNFGIIVSNQTTHTKTHQN